MRSRSGWPGASRDGCGSVRGRSAGGSGRGRPAPARPQAASADDPVGGPDRPEGDRNAPRVVDSPRPTSVAALGVGVPSAGAPPAPPAVPAPRPPGKVVRRHAGNEVPLPHEDQRSHRSDEGDRGGDGHQVVERGGEADLVGTDQGVPDRGGRDGGRRLADPTAVDGGVEPAAAVGAGTPGRRAWPRGRPTVLGRIWLRNTAPRPAMPVAMPTWRKVLDDPVAMPLRSGGTTDTEAEASTGLVIPTPMPASDEAGQEHRPGGVGLDVGHQLAARGPPGTGPRPSRYRGVDPDSELAGHRGHHEGQHGHGQEPEAGGEGPVAQHLLEVEGEIEEHGEDRGGQGEGGQRDARPWPVV